MWMRLASHLGLPLQVVQQTTTSTEFLRWCEFLQEDRNDHKPIHWYLAQIACLIARSFGGKRSAKVEDFLIKFEFDAGDEAKWKRLKRKQQSAR